MATFGPPVPRSTATTHPSSPDWDWPTSPGPAALGWRPRHRAGQHLAADVVEERGQVVDPDQPDTDPIRHLEAGCLAQVLYVTHELADEPAPAQVVVEGEVEGHPLPP